MRNERSVHHTSVMWSIEGGTEEEEIDAGTPPLRTIRHLQSRTHVLSMCHLVLLCVVMCVTITLVVAHTPSVECERSARQDSR